MGYWKPCQGQISFFVIEQYILLLSYHRMEFRFLAMYLFGDFARVIRNRYPHRWVGLTLSKINKRNRDLDHIE